MRWKEISFSKKICGILKKIEILKNIKLCSNSEWILPSPKNNSKHILYSTIHQAWDKIRKKA